MNDKYGEEFAYVPGLINNISKNTQRMENLYGEQMQKAKSNVRKLEEILFNPIEVANSGIPAKNSVLTDEEEIDFKMLGRLTSIKEQVASFKSQYKKARKEEAAIYTLFSLANSNTNRKRYAVKNRIIKNATDFNNIIKYLTRYLNPTRFKKNMEFSEIIQKYISICRQKSGELIELSNGVSANTNTKKNNGTPAGLNIRKPVNAVNTGNVGCTGFGCFPWFTRKNKKNKNK